MALKLYWVYVYFHRSKISTGGLNTYFKLTKRGSGIYQSPIYYIINSYLLIYYVDYIF